MPEFDALNLERGGVDFNPAGGIEFLSLSRAGLLESGARDAGYNVTVNRSGMADWCTARRTNEKHGSYEVIIYTDTGTILGAHLLGGHAGEVINMFAGRDTSIENRRDRPIPSQTIP